MTIEGGSQEQSKVESVFEEMPYKTATLDNGVTVAWYQKLEDVPTGLNTMDAFDVS